MFPTQRTMSRVKFRLKGQIQRLSCSCGLGLRFHSESYSLPPSLSWQIASIPIGHLVK